MTRIRRILTFLLAVFCLSALLFLSGCGPGIYIFWHGVRDERGDWPTPRNSPYSQWICREKNLFFCMWAENMREATGEYRSGDTVWHIQGKPDSLYGIIRFTFNTADTREASEQTDGSGVPYARLVRGKEAYVTFSYLYQDGAMTCTVRESDHEDFRPQDVLTFDRSSDLAQMPRARFQCREMPMWLDAFYDADGYYAGKIEVGGKEYDIRMIKCSDADCYTVYWYYPEGYPIDYIPAKTFIIFRDQTMIWNITDAEPYLPRDYSAGIFPGATLTFTVETAQN